MRGREGDFVKKDVMTTLSDWSEKYIPDAFPLVLILTLMVAVSSWFLTKSTISSIALNWYDGFWGMLTFTIQVCLLMFTGYMVSDARPVKRVLKRLAKIPRNRIQAVLLFLVFEEILYYLHFALGIAGAIVMGKALIVEQRKKGIYLPLNMIVAIGCFCLVFQAGPTAGSPLLVASEGHFLQAVIGVIPITESMLTLPMICLNILMAIAYVVMCFWFAKNYQLTEDEVRMIDGYSYEMEQSDLQKYETVSERVNHYPYIQILIGIVGLGVFLATVAQNGAGSISLNLVNFLFLMLALILHKNPAAMSESARTAITTISGVLLQYPFYAGIFGILQYSGLARVLIESFVAIASPRLFTFIIFVFSALLNMVVPSGGSQFILEAPYIMPAAINMGKSLAYTLNAFTLGDLVTNLIQPFWAIPVLAAFGIKFKHIFPYCFIAFLVAFILISCFFIGWMY